LYNNEFVLFQAAVFANCDEELKDVAYSYGRDIGIAFQVSFKYLSHLEGYLRLCHYTRFVICPSLT